jgi:hypothetical protein
VRDDLLDLLLRPARRLRTTVAGRRRRGGDDRERGEDERQPAHRPSIYRGTPE